MQNPHRLLYFVVTIVFAFLLIIVAFLTSTRSFQSNNDDNFKEDVAEATLFPETNPKECKISGCSGTICIDASAEDVITTCEYRSEYACYKAAICEKQEDGKCGWTQTEELKNCLENPPSSNPSLEPYL